MDIKKYVQQGESWVVTAQKAYEAQNKRKYFEKLEAMLFNDLKHQTKGQPSCGGGLVFYPEQSVGAVDYKNIPELKDVDLNAYRKESIMAWKLKPESSLLNEDHISQELDANVLP